ncbi:CWF19-like protein Drn1p [[Candida] railenensis]|uniref:CWF19-like protein Drn1p n=1 Tax=[Candida] railenensis TaxID=45579 RepID=A0A9P0QQ38_9ASCO|nr:CWF19-like protein Drn1p [[Candida] railenensis]
MSKFLVLNPDPNDLNDVLSKANLQNSKNGPFEAVLLLGDVMSNLDPPAIEVSQRTYFGRGPKTFKDVPAEEIENKSLDIKENLTFLGKPLNIVTLKSGFTVAFLSSQLNEAEKEDVLTQSKQSVKFSSVDILITYLWPKAIARQNKLTLVADSTSFTDKLVELMKPRYHFAVGSEKGRFYESEAFKWKVSASDSSTNTRFISLGQKGTGEKWFYAFGIDKSSPSSDDASTGLNPFELEVNPTIASLPAIPGTKRPHSEVREDSDGNSLPVSNKKISMSQCFFCLSNPRCETHMIISIGKHNYLTVAKGPLPPPAHRNRNNSLGFSGHAIIIPIEHMPTNRLSDSKCTETPLYKEYLQFQDSLIKSFTDGDNYSLVFFEINRQANIHHHTQMVPVPNNLIQTFEASLSEREQNNNEKFLRNSKLKFDKFEDSNDPKLIESVNGTKDFILFTVCKKAGDKTYYISELDGSVGKGVDLQFPRRVLASVLRCGKRVYWEKCRQTLSEETEECERFKSFYKENDFS